jgi:putative oxidoreductase
MAHAWLELAMLTLPGTAAFFERFGFPGWTAYPGFALDLFGGTALIVAQAACFRHAAASRLPATMSSTARMPKAA